MKEDQDKYAAFVEPFRYGRSPNITRINPSGGDTRLHWHSPKECRIPNTGIRADVSRQRTSLHIAEYYFDVKRECVDCGRQFIFFAEEQECWYEVLGFCIHSDCVRCAECRKRHRGVAAKRERYEELFHVAGRADDENLEMADCCLSLMEASVISKQQIQHVRMLLNLVQSQADSRTRSRRDELLARVVAIETQVAARNAGEDVSAERDRFVSALLKSRGTPSGCCGSRVD